MKLTFYFWRYSRVSTGVDWWNSAEVRIFSKLGHRHGRRHGNMDKDMGTSPKTGKMEKEMQTRKRSWEHGRGHGDIDNDMETWMRTWKHGHIYMERWIHGDVDT
jgi:hypothetical protein